ncbi:MAG: hypothetical protein IJ767_00475 [Bacteroidaceae bacterium]|nr:hypothetical protein [Bacteroidaceae bacterium]MBR1799961.1 hypothetical protein [Bacteroidaceae bacterium]
MKKQYIQPIMQAVKIQQTQMLCSSPYDDVKSLRTYDDDDDVISDKDEIW